MVTLLSRVVKNGLYKLAIISFVSLMLSAGVASAPLDDTEFFVWLFPDKNSFRTFDNMISKLSLGSDDLKSWCKDISGLPELPKFARTFHFLPHLTLYHGKLNSLEDLQALNSKIVELAVGNNPIELTVAGIIVGAPRFKSLGVAFKNNERILDCYHKIKPFDANEQKYTLNPHLSLFYPEKDSKLSICDKLVLAAIASKIFDLPTNGSVCFNKIALIRKNILKEEDNPNNWVPYSGDPNVKEPRNNIAKGYELKKGYPVRSFKIQKKNSEWQIPSYNL